MLQLVRNFPGNRVVLCQQVMLCISQGQERIVLKTSRNQNINGVTELKMLVQGSVAVGEEKKKANEILEVIREAKQKIIEAMIRLLYKSEYCV